MYFFPNALCIALLLTLWSPSAAAQHPCSTPDDQPPRLYDSSPWIQTDQLLANDRSSRDRLGYAVDISASYAVAGAWGVAAGTNLSDGAVYVFQPTASGPYEQTAKLTASDAEQGDNFGTAVATEGQAVIVGAPNEDTRGLQAGAVYVFSAQSDGSWQQSTKLTATDAAPGDRFGYSVALAGDYLIVGAPWAGAGVVYVLQRDGAGGWNPSARLSAPDGRVGDEFGYAVAISGTRLLVSAPGEIIESTDGRSGGAYIFELHAASGEWEETGHLIPNASSPASNFGKDVDISGEKAIVGEGYGRAYIFHRTPTGRWDQRAELSSTADQNAAFGDCVGLIGNLAVVGSAAEDQFTGSAYVFVEDAKGSWTQVSKLTASDGTTDDHFGGDVAIGPAGILIGADRYNEGFSVFGAAYVYAPPVTTTLPDVTLTDCGTPVTVGTPVAYDGCGGPIRGTTTDPMTFNQSGQYSVNWSFQDASGNTLTAVQSITVVAGDLAIDQVTVSPTTCPTEPAGQLSVIAGCAACTGPLQYSLDGQVYQTANTFEDLTAGDYNVWVRDADSPGCFVTGGTYTIAGTDAEPPILPGGNGGWIQSQQLTAGNGGATDNFGSAVAVSESHVLVGAVRGDEGATDAGVAYLYKRDGIRAQFVTTLKAVDPVAGDNFGAAVAIDGKWALVGAPDKGRGVVYAYYNRSGDEWLLAARLEDQTAQFGDGYGTSVAVDGNYMAVGIPEDGRTTPGAGRVQIFRWDESQARIVTENVLRHNDRAPGDAFGSSVAISGSSVVVGAPGRVVAEQQGAGAAYVFENLHLYPVQVAEITATSPTGRRNFGTGVGMYGDQVIAGGGGVAEIHERNPVTGIWERRAALTSPNPLGNYFGRSVDISATHAVVGSGFEDFGAFASGGLFVYSRNPAGDWQEVDQVVHADPAAFDALGFRVALHDDLVLAGANTRDVEGVSDAGAAYLFSPEVGGVLPDITLQVCASAVALSPPTAEDACAGTIVGTTEDPITFREAGTYVVTWTFDDGNGNTVNANQTVIVEVPAVLRFVRDGSGVPSPPTCPGAADGSVTLSATCSNCLGNLEYTIDGIEYQSSPTFTGLAAGEYSAYVRDAAIPTCMDFASLTVAEGLDTSDPILDRSIYTSWNPDGQVGNPDADSRHSFGYQLAQEGAYTVVGDYHNQSQGEDAGAVFVYDGSSDGPPRLVATLHSDDIEAIDLFGYSVDISEEYIIVGAFNEGTQAPGAGAAYIFHRQSDGSWAQQAKLMASDGIDYAHFGISVGLTGGRAIVGARDQGDTPTDRKGAAYIFERQEDGSWPQVAKLSRANDDTGGQIGNSVAIDGDIALVGNNIDPLAFTSAGSVYVYERSSDGRWQPSAKLRADDISGYFGFDLAISGETALIGAPRDNEGDYGTGAAYVFVKDPTLGWIQQEKLRASNPTEGAEFGEAVALDGNYAVVGSADASSVARMRGAAYVFHREPGSSFWSERSILTPPSDEATQFYGFDVAISNGHLAVSAPNLSTIEIPAAQLYFYRPERALVKQTISLCDGVAYAIPPTATDNCAGQFTALTTDPTSFTIPGTYTIDWTFDDGNGNRTVSPQTVEVVGYTPGLPFSETAEPDSPARSC